MPLAVEATGNALSCIADPKQEESPSSWGFFFEKSSG
jgi:hypothetical protein